MRASLAELLDPRVLAGWRRQPALLAAAALLARWHTSGAEMLLGGAGGRALATAWLRRVGLTGGSVLTPAIGFLGFASDYRPTPGRSWTSAWLAAAQRAGERATLRLDRLCAADRRLADLAAGRRASSRLGLVAEQLVRM